MIAPEESARRIDALEKRLAAVQTEAIPVEIEAALRQNSRSTTLAVAAGIAVAAASIIAGLAQDFERNIQRMADDLNGDR